MADQSTLDQLERSLTEVLRLLADRATTSDVASRCGYDLPPASWALLEHLETHGALRISDIATCHGVDISSITPRLKRLKKAGLVARGSLPTDARVSLISITPEGTRALESVHAARREILHPALGEINASRLAEAAGVLAQIATRLSKEPPSRLTGGDSTGVAR